MSTLPLHNDDSKSNIGNMQQDDSSPMYSSTPHSLHTAFRASSSHVPALYLSDGNVFADSDGVTTSSDDESTSYSSGFSTTSETSEEQIGTISLRQKKFTRKGSREQRKSLMHKMHQTRQRKECVGI